MLCQTCQSLQSNLTRAGVSAQVDIGGWIRYFRHLSFEEPFADDPPVSDPEQEAAMKRLELLVRDLPAGQIDKLSDIIQTIL